MNNEFKKVLDEAHANIQRNPHLRQEWEDLFEEDRNNMLMEMIYNVGFDHGYEHRKKVEAAK